MKDDLFDFAVRELCEHASEFYNEGDPEQAPPEADTEEAAPLYVTSARRPTDIPAPRRSARGA